VFTYILIIIYIFMDFLGSTFTFVYDNVILNI